MKKILVLSIIIIVSAMFFACIKEVKESEATKLAKAFYEEYFAQEDENETAFGRMGNAERLEVVKRRYLTENLIEELHLRSRQDSCDAITNSQDDMALRGKLVFSNGKNENTAIVTYMDEFENGGYNKDIIELHFIDTDEGKRADSLNVYHEDKDATGNVNTYERKTKWAIHGDFTEEDIREMESIKKKLDDLEAEGFIG